jgi:hypothetical protein
MRFLFDWIIEQVERLDQYSATNVCYLLDLTAFLGREERNTNIEGQYYLMCEE